MQVVKWGYESEGAELPQGRAHEVRAWSASVALHQAVPLSDILQAAFWLSEGTFINFYPRDARHLGEDGYFGMSSVVVAQTSVSLPPKSL